MSFAAGESLEGHGCSQGRVAAFVCLMFEEQSGDSAPLFKIIHYSVEQLFIFFHFKIVAYTHRRHTKNICMHTCMYACVCAV